MHMKIKNGFMLKKVGGQNVVVALGEASRSFNGIIRLNDTGVFLWQKLQQETSEEQLLAALTAEYDIGEEQAKSDIAEFVAALRKATLLV